MAKSTPWAVLLCKFKDRTEPELPKEKFELLFTTQGQALWNMTRFFDDNSHGAIDVTGSKVFGWFEIDANLADYQNGTMSRNEMMKRAQDAAIANKVPLSSFYGVVLTSNVAIGGAFGGFFAATVSPGACGDHRYVYNNGSQAFGQEMGHGYGLNHSRLDGSTADYQDMWDAMSTGNAFSGSDPTFGARGPGLNAANMRYMKWLDESRVWKATDPKRAIQEVVTLRPLHRRDLSGYLAAEIPPYGGTGFSGYLIELRLREGWDSGIPRPAVLVHQLRTGNSYIMPGTGGNVDLVKGDRFQRGGGAPWAPTYAVEVLDIDAANRNATVGLHYQPARLPHFEIFSKVIGSIGVDGGGLVIGPGGVSPVGPWNPMAGVLKHVAALEAADLISETQLRFALRRNELGEIARIVAAEIAEIDAFGAPAPPDVAVVPERGAIKRRTKTNVPKKKPARRR